MTANVIPIYVGFDPREEVGYHTFCASVIHHASCPVAFTPLHQDMLRQEWSGGHRDGSNAFAYTRFLVPHIQLFQGWAMFCDGADMVMRADIAELWEHRDLYAAVQVVKHEYQTKHPRKYVGTQMEADNRDYPRKNWSSVMLINCSHYAWRQMTPGRVSHLTGAELHGFEWVGDQYLKALPAEWNWLVDEYGPNADAKLLHWTAGIPGFSHYFDAPMAEEWYRYKKLIDYATP